MKNNEVPAIPFPASAVLWLHVREQSGIMLLREFEKITDKNTPAIAKEAGGNWLYGQGVGETAVAAGGIFVFPPYALYLLGNAALSYSGYEPLYVSNALPEDAKASWNQTYETVTSAPGKLNAAIAGEEFRSQDLIKERYQSLAAKLDTEGK